MANSPLNVLVLKASEPTAFNYETLLNRDEATCYQILTTTDRGQIDAVCRSQPIDCILWEKSAEPTDGADWLKDFLTNPPPRPPVLILGSNDARAAVQALKAGAADYLVKEQVTAAELSAAIHAAIAANLPPTLTDISAEAGFPSFANQPCQAIAEALPQIVWLADANGQVNYWNQQWYEYTGLSPANSIGEAGVEVVHPEERDRTLERWQQAIVAGCPFEIEYRLRRRDGVYRWFISRALPTHDAHDRVTGWLGTITDIDEQKQLEQQLLQEIRQHQQTQEALHNANQRVTGVLESMTDAFVAVDNNWHITYINQAATHINQLESPAAWIGKSHWEAWPDTRGTIVEEHYRQAIATQTAVHFEYFYESQQRWYEIHAYPSTEGLGIYFRDIHDRKQAELDSQRHSAMLQAFMAAAPIAMALFDCDLRFLYANAAVAKLCELPAHDLAGHRLEAVLPAIAPQLAPRLRQIIATNSPDYAIPFEGEVRPGVLRHTLANLYPVRLPTGEVIGAGIAVMDLSDLKRAQTALAVQEEQYRYIFEAVNVAIWEEDYSAVKAAIEQLKQSGVEDFEQYFAAHPEFVQQAGERVRLRNANQAALKVFQSPHREALLAARQHIFLPETCSTFVAELLAIAQGEPFFEAAIPMQTLQGDRIQVWLRVTFPTADASYDRVLVSLLDITEQTRAEMALKESEARFRTLADNVSQFTWMADASGWIFWYNQRWFDYTGTTLEQMQGWGWRQVHHPDHVDRVVAKISQCFRSGEPWEDTFPLRGRNGEYRWFLSRALPIYDEAGNILRWFGSNTDITTLKQTEAALADNEARLRGFVEANIVGILYGDIHGNIFRANDELLRIIGYTRDDLTAGRLDWIELTPPEYLPLDLQAIAEAQDRGACTPYEKEYIRKDGRRVPVLLGYSLLGSDRQESVAFVLDLSARKQAEKALARSEDRLRLAIESAELGTWDWNLLTNELTWDARCKAMFGLPAEANTSIETFFAAIHPDDRPRLEGIVELALDPASGGSYDAEFRTIGLQDRVERWVACQGQAYFNADATPRRFIGTVLDITHRKQAEQALRESEERLHMALEGAEGGLWDWNIVTGEVYFSPQWLEMLGYDRGELAENHLAWQDLIHPEDQAWVLERLQAHLQDGAVPYQFEYRLLAKSGEWKWIANSGKVVVRDDQGAPLRMSGIHFDLSDRKLLEENLRRSENRYRTLANAVSQLMWINDSHGRIEFYNQQWRTYTGVEDLELGVGLWASIIHPDDLPGAAAVRAQALHSGEAYELECRLLRHDLTYRWHLARVVPLSDEQGQVLAWFGTATDIHDRKCAAAEREQLLLREKAAREEAERANRIKDEFLAILSHELRSPLNPILGWAKLLQTRQFDAERTAQALATIERNARLQTQLIDDLLDIAKILRGKLKLDNTAVEVERAIISAIETVRTAAAAKGIMINSDLDDAVKIWGDAGRIQQIVWNLLSNAIKFTPEGGRVEICLSANEHQARICVSDTGQGINPRFLPHIFKSFQQEDISITRKHGGLGLGLAIVRYLVEAHGGMITADSHGEGKGATFIVELPLLNRDLSPEDTDRSTRDRFDLSGIRVLAVDDNPDTCELIETLLMQYGAEVKVFNSATQVLANLTAFKPDVLISDIGMPDIDGYTLIRQIRSRAPEEGGAVPAIALTAYTREVDQQDAFDSGFQAHIPKPIEVERLIKSISGLIRRDR